MLQNRAKYEYVLNSEMNLIRVEMSFLSVTQEEL